MNIPYPQKTPWPIWAATVIGFNPELTNQLSPIMEWQYFGDRITMFIPQAPRTAHFRDWRDWAAALAQVAAD